MATGIERSGVKRIRLHDLRHSHASMLVDMGVAPLEIAERLGHEKVETTLNTYSHLHPSTQSKLAGLTYIRCGDYDIPNLKLSEQPETSIGKYGRMQKSYLKEHRPILYNHLLMSEKLYPHLLEIERTAQGRVETMLPHMMEVAGGTEELKACDPMRWVGLMNTLKAQAEEIIQDELIYK